MFTIYADGEAILNPIDPERCVIAPMLTLEMGKAGGLEFSVPPNNAYYDKFRKLQTIVTVFLDDSEIFRGRVLSEERNFANVKKVYCEGDLAFLVDSVQKNDRYIGTTHELFKLIIARHNERVELAKRFAVGQVGIEDREIIISGQSADIEDVETGEFDYKQIAINASTSDWKTSYDYIQDCLIDYCGGYLRTRRVGDVTYIDLLVDFGHTATQEIEFSRNMLDLTEEVTAEELFTVLIPLGDDNLTIESVNGGSDELADAQAVATYGRILKTHIFPNVSDPGTLLENAERFLKSNANLPVTITVKAVDMHLVESSIEELHVGDKIHVKSKVHNLVDYLTCTKIELDLENPGNNTYTFGNPRQSMTDRYRKDIRKAEDAASGGSSSGGSGGGTSGAAAAAEASTSKADAWCTVLKEEAFASIGASNERIDDMQNVLKTECGIDFDGNTGNINIRSMYTKLSETGEQLVQQGAYIHLLQEDLESRIELNVARVSNLEGIHNEHVATFTMFANDTESAIEAKADRVTVNAIRIELDALNTTTEGIAEDVGQAQAGLSATYKRLDVAENAIKTNAASITAVSDQIESKVSVVASSVDLLGSRTASLEVKANSLESAIEAQADRIDLKANTTTLNSNVTTINGKITNLNTEITNVRKLIADEIEARQAEIGRLEAGGIKVSNLSVDNLYANNYVSAPAIRMGGQTVATQAWVQEQLSSLSTVASVDWANITGKPTAFVPTSHRHTFSISERISNGHTHNVVVDGTTYTSTGVSTNSTHNIDISGNTGYSGG